ncbi:MAG: hypothetical protein EA379_08545 [Phycisphaerales bacterium]|nr:MAG: hypothetical protein EA379_08545 [Phycisphaerales bacterium]
MYTRRARHTAPLALVATICAIVALTPHAWAGAGAAESARTPAVHVSEHMTVDMRLQDEELANVLQLLSLQSNRNIVASRAVSARVTANLYGATFYEALDAILHVNGYGYVERGHFIYVYTLDELRQIRRAERRPVAKVITLNYLNGNDAAAFVTPLLSESGQIRTNGDVGTFSIPDGPVGADSYALASTLVVYDYPEHVEEIERLVRQLDTRPAQVLVEATILQTKLTEANAFGVDFSVIGNLNFSDFVASGGPLSVFNALRSPGGGDGQGGVGAQEGTGVVSTPGNTGAPGGTLRIGVVEGDFSLFIRMLDEVADTTVLSNPKILALNRQPARVLVGRRLGYLSTTATETSTTQSVQFLDTGTQLSFRPFISNDGMIRMELRPSVSQGFIRQSVDSGGVPISIPDEETQELTTNVIVRDGSTIVLGGLFKESTSLTRRQVPILGDIPIIGAPFRGHDDEIDRVEIIFLITPTIVHDNSLLAQGEKAMEYTELVRAGARQGLLPWSRERMTAKLNVEADELMRKGDREQALWKVRRSLELNPTQPDAIRLREKLTQEFERWPVRSVLEDIYRASDPATEPDTGPDASRDEEAPGTPAAAVRRASESPGAAGDAAVGGVGALASQETAFRFDELHAGSPRVGLDDLEPAVAELHEPVELSEGVLHRLWAPLRATGAVVTADANEDGQ